MRGILSYNIHRKDSSIYSFMRALPFFGFFLFALIAQFLTNHKTMTRSQMMFIKQLPSTKPHNCQRNHLGSTLWPKGEL